MSDYASIMGGGTTPADAVGHRYDQLDDVGRSWNAYYHLESKDVFLDRFGSSGDSLVDARANTSGVHVEVGSGSDTVAGGSGGDDVWTGAGNDTASGGAGADTLSGASGDDMLAGDAGNDSLSGGAGDDTLRAGSGDDSVAGGSGADSIRGDEGNDSLFGGSGDDALYGQDGDDMLVGGSGADLLMGGAGDDTMFGGSGRDVYAFDSGFGDDVISDFRPGDQINLGAYVRDLGVNSGADLVAKGMVTGGTTEAGTKFTVITIAADTLTLERVDHADFINQIGSWVKVG